MTKIHVSSYQAQGEPDLIACYKGHYLAFETKSKGNNPTPLQEYKLSEIRKAGGIAIPTYSLQEVEEVLNELSEIQHSGEPR